MGGQWQEADCRDSLSLSLSLSLVGEWSEQKRKRRGRTSRGEKRTRLLLYLHSELLVPGVNDKDALDYSTTPRLLVARSELRRRSGSMSGTPPTYPLVAIHR